MAQSRVKVQPIQSNPSNWCAITEDIIIWVCNARILELVMQAVRKPTFIDLAYD